MNNKYYQFKDSNAFIKMSFQEISNKRLVWKYISLEKEDITDLGNGWLRIMYKTKRVYNHIK